MTLLLPVNKIFERLKSLDLLNFTDMLLINISSYK
jgi:hypothetical protein